MPKGKKKGKKKAKAPRVTVPTCASAGLVHIDKATAVTLQCATEGAVIHYTLDGTDPTASSKRFARPFDVKAPGTTVLKAIGVKEDILDSAIFQADITVEVDPWRRFRSPMGGKLSVVEEWDKLARGDIDETIEVSLEQVRMCAAPRSTAAATATATSNVSAAGAGTAEAGLRLEAAALDAVVRRAQDDKVRADAMAAAAAVAAASAATAAASESTGADAVVGVDTDAVVGEGAGTSAGVEEAATAVGRGAVSVRAETSTGSHVATFATAGAAAGAGAGGHASSAPAATAVVSAPHTDTLGSVSAPPELPEALALRSCELCGFRLDLQSKVHSRLTALDLTDNLLTHAPEQFALQPPVCWLRRLVLTANRLREVPDLRYTPKLLSLDLSFNPLGPAIHASGDSGDALAAVPQLVELKVEACGLNTLGGAGSDSSPFSNLPALKVLDASGNQLKGNTALEAINGAALAQLESVDLSDNPISADPAMEAEYKAWTEAFQRAHTRLKVFDGRELQTGLINANYGAMQFRHDDDPNVQDGASCSCLEGNPCAVKYNCKNWPRRFEIAKRVREKKERTLGGLAGSMG